MRNKARLFVFAGLFFVVGCDQTRFNIFRGNDPPPSGKPPSVEQLVAYLNDNAGRIQTIRSDYLSLTVHQGLQSGGLSGKIMVEKPRGLRLMANMAGSNVVDMGSNQEEFWYWVSKADPPYQFYCSYNALKAGGVRHMPFPFQPEWIVEAMGMGPYGPADRYKQEVDTRTVQLVERPTSPQGKPVRKVIVFSRRPVQPPEPQLMACLLLDDATGHEICSAHILDTYLDRQTGAIVPKRLELRWPENKLKLSLTLNGLAVNQQSPPEVFVRRPLNGVPSFDLATGRVEGGNAAVQRLQSR